MADSDQQETMLKTAAGVAGGALLFSPVGMPIVHGVAGLAVASLGLIAAGSAVGAIADKVGTMFAPKEEHREDDFKDFMDDDDE